MFDSKAYDKKRNQDPKRKQRRKERYQETKAIILERNRKWREVNKKALKERTSSEEFKKRRNAYLLEKRRDPEYILVKSLRDRIRKALFSQSTYKNNKTMSYVGCTKQELKEHIESQFTEGMSWDNYGDWHIDHIYPLSKIDLSKEDNLYFAMSYKNLQPLWAKDNLRKHAKYV